MKIKQLFILLSLIAGNELYAESLTPSPVEKNTDNKIYVHLMPWFEAKDFSGYWGIHWTMANRNPDIVDPTGKRQIAAHYYPMIGPYASGDPDVVEYQLLLMKFAGVDSVLIDWPGTTSALDYVRNRQNAEALIQKVSEVGLEFAVVYEDHNLSLANVGDKLGQGRNDMAYLRDNYFNRQEYSTIGNKPLMLVFGPQTFQNPNEWSNVFSVLPTKPHFLTLWYEHGEAGEHSQGEYAWIYQDGQSYLSHLTNFYQNATSYGTKMGAVAPGFNAFYEAGGWGANPFSISHNGTESFEQTLDLALDNNVQHIQVATWNDYGEGTMIEPTREFGYGFLRYMQQRLGVDLGESDLILVTELFNQRKQYVGNIQEQARLNQVFNLLASMQIDKAREKLIGDTPQPTPTATPPPQDTNATLYEHCGYGGYSASLNIGTYTLSQLTALGIKDNEVSSLKVAAGYQVRLFDLDNFAGRVLIKDSSDDCLDDNDDYNDKVSSAIIELIDRPWSVIVEAEDYVASSDIGIEQSSEGGENIGWLDVGDWVVWDIDLPANGAYSVEYRVAGLRPGIIQLEVAGGSQIYGQIEVPVSGGWQQWQTISHTLNLPAGQQQIAIYVPANGYNINWIKFTQR